MENSRLQNERWKIQDFKMKFMRRDLFKLKTSKKKIEWFNDNKTNVYSVSCLKESSYVSFEGKQSFLETESHAHLFNYCVYCKITS